MSFDAEGAIIGPTTALGGRTTVHPDEVAVPFDIPVPHRGYDWSKTQDFLAG